MNTPQYGLLAGLAFLLAMPATASPAPAAQAERATTPASAPSSSVDRKKPSTDKPARKRGRGSYRGHDNG